MGLYLHWGFRLDEGNEVRLLVMKEMLQPWGSMTTRSRLTLASLSIAFVRLYAIVPNKVFEFMSLLWLPMIIISSSCLSTPAILEVKLGWKGNNATLILPYPIISTMWLKLLALAWFYFEVIYSNVRKSINGWLHVLVVSLEPSKTTVYNETMGTVGIQI